MSRSSALGISAHEEKKEKKNVIGILSPRKWFKNLFISAPNEDLSIN